MPTCIYYIYYSVIICYLWVVCVCMVQGTQSVRADDEPDTRPTIGEEGSTLRLTTTEMPGRLFSGEVRGNHTPLAS